MKKLFSVIIASALLASPMAANADSRILTYGSHEWGWDYIDGTMDGKFVSKYNGEGVDIFVIDSGIDSASSNIMLKAAKDFTSDAGTENENKDCLMHGNSVASIISGEDFGVANKANVYSAKVFACGEENPTVTSDVLTRALQWVYETRTPDNPTIVNLSLGGLYDGSLFYAIHQLTSNGVIVVAGAGNENADACNYTPVAFPNVIGVGALNRDLSQADFSNYGSCVDYWAPGEEVVVKCSVKKGEYCYSRGTSLASPFVAGVIALFLQNNPNATYDEVVSWLDVNSVNLGDLKSVQIPKDYVGDPTKFTPTSIISDTTVRIKANVRGKKIKISVPGLKKEHMYKVNLGKGQWRTYASGTLKNGVTTITAKAKGRYTLILYYSTDKGKTWKLVESATVKVDIKK